MTRCEAAACAPLQSRLEGPPISGKLARMALDGVTMTARPHSYSVDGILHRFLCYSEWDASWPVAFLYLLGKLTYISAVVHLGLLLLHPCRGGWTALLRSWVAQVQEAQDIMAVSRCLDLVGGTDPKCSVMSILALFSLKRRLSPQMAAPLDEVQWGRVGWPMWQTHQYTWAVSNILLTWGLITA